MQCQEYQGFASHGNRVTPVASDVDREDLCTGIL
jgi:hypothetical protein